MSKKYLIVLLFLVTAPAYSGVITITIALSAGGTFIQKAVGYVREKKYPSIQQQAEAAELNSQQKKINLEKSVATEASLKKDKEQQDAISREQEKIKIFQLRKAIVELCIKHMNEPLDNEGLPVSVTAKAAEYKTLVNNAEYNDLRKIFNNCRQSLETARA